MTRSLASESARTFELECHFLLHHFGRFCHRRHRNQFPIVSAHLPFAPLLLYTTPGRIVFGLCALWNGVLLLLNVCRMEISTFHRYESDDNAHRCVLWVKSLIIIYYRIKRRKCLHAGSNTLLTQRNAQRNAFTNFSSPYVLLLPLHFDFFFRHYRRRLRRQFIFVCTIRLIHICASHLKRTTLA